MANEAVILELFGQPKGEPLTWTVENTTGIEKGTICSISGADLTACASSDDGEYFAGIASTEKVASDGSTTLGLWTKGVFDLKHDAGTSVIGDLVKISGANLIATIETGEEKYAFGRALEAASESEVIRVAVGAL